MLKIAGFPNCCNAYVVFNFKETKFNQFEVDRNGCNPRVVPDSYQDMERELDDYIYEYGHKLITATTNNEQKTANKLLLAKGFKHSVWMSKTQHRTTKLRLWWREPNNW